jgi:phosphoglycolate phosphatase
VRHYACGADLFGKRSKIREVLKEARVPPPSAISIGDEIRDIEAAAAEGIATGAVTWGYASADALRARAPTAMFHSVDELARALAG